MPATEICLLKLKPNTSINEGDAKSVWQDIVNEVVSQPGAQRAYYGVTEEDSTMLRLFVDWHSIADHKKFMASDGYNAFIQKVKTLVDNVEGVYHAHLEPHPPSKALSKASSPATELLTVFFPAHYSSHQMAKFQSDIAQLIGAIETNGGDSFTGFSGGWIEESEVANPANSEHKGKAYFAAIGWKSVQAHLDFRETEHFKKNIHLLRAADGLLGLHVQHYHGVEVQK